jgi:O-antigen ligase
VSERTAAIPIPNRGGRPAAVATGIAVGAIAGILPVAILPLAGLFLVSVLYLLYPAAALGLLLAARSSLDYFLNTSILPAPFAVNPASALGMVLIFLAALTIFLRSRAGRPVEWGGSPAALWGGWIAFCAFDVIVGALLHGAPVAAAGARELIRLASLLAVYLLVVNLVRRPGQTHLLVWALLAGMLIPAAVGLHELITGNATHNVYGIKRIAGTFGHPNSLGRYLGTIAILAIGFWGDVRRNGTRLVLLLAAALAGFLLLFTYSRSALGILILALIWWSFTGSLRRKVFTALGLVAAALVALPSIAWRFQDLFAPETGGTTENSFYWRLLNFRGLLETFLKSPIVGHGLRAAGFVNPERLLSQEGFDVGFASHNELVRVLVEQGALGALVYAIFAIWFLRVLWRLARAQRPSERGGLPALGNAVFAYTASSFLLCSIGSELFSQTVVLYLIVTVTGLLYMGRSRGAATVRRVTG